VALELLDIYVTLSQVPHEEVVMKGYGRSLLMASLFVLASFLGSESSMAVDELYLCGIVKETNMSKGVVTIDVRSESCYGERQFYVSPAEISTFILRSERCFSIDSNTCHTGKIYTIKTQNR